MQGHDDLFFAQRDENNDLHGAQTLVPSRLNSTKYRKRYIIGSLECSLTLVVGGGAVQVTAPLHDDVHSVVRATSPASLFLLFTAFKHVGTTVAVVVLLLGEGGVGRLIRFLVAAIHWLSFRARKPLREVAICFLKLPWQCEKGTRQVFGGAIGADLASSSIRTYYMMFHVLWPPHLLGIDDA